MKIWHCWSNSECMKKGLFVNPGRRCIKTDSISGFCVGQNHHVRICTGPPMVSNIDEIISPDLN